jgi:hypothetical protein
MAPHLRQSDWLWKLDFIPTQLQSHTLPLQVPTQAGLKRISAEGSGAGSP